MAILRFFIFIILCGFSLTSMPISAKEKEQEKELEILFTHDLHSHLESFPVKFDGVQQQMGGFARIATIIQQKKQENDAVLTVDAGDFSMGTFYQTIYESEAAELRMLGQIGFDAVTLGNHETDYRNQGLANMLTSAVDSGDRLPQMVVSNLSFENAGKEEEIVQEAMKRYGTKRYTIIEKNGIKIGLFGIFGKTSIEYSPMCTLNFTDQVESAKEMVKVLKKEGAEIIVCLSHSGTDSEYKNSEDEILAEKVPEIDVIISGHTHTSLEEPIQSKDTVIASTGEYGIEIGSMKLKQKENGRWELVNYELIPVTSSIKEDKDTVHKRNEMKQLINQQYFAQFGYKIGQVLAVNSNSFTPMEQLGKTHEEETLGNLIADSYVSTVEQEEGENYDPIAASFVPVGVIRASLPEGKVKTEDVFQILSLGIGKDKIAGYPLVSVYLTGKELKTVAEVDASISPMMDVAQLYSAGLHFTFNPNRMLLNKVTEVSLWDEEKKEQIELEDDKLYRVVSDLYTGQMLSTVEDKSFGLLSIVPKDKEGNEIENLEDQIVYRQDGLELKAWLAVAEYLQSFESNTKEEIPTVPKSYQSKEGRKKVNDKKNIKSLISQPNFFTWLFIGIATLVFLFVMGIIYLVRRSIKGRRNRK